MAVVEKKTGMTEMMMTAIKNSFGSNEMAETMMAATNRDNNSGNKMEMIMTATRWR